MKSFKIVELVAVVLLSLLLTPALMPTFGQRVSESQKTPARGAERLAAQIATMQEAEELLASQQPSVLPDTGCVDGVCIQLVRSAGEYLDSQPKGVHRFTVVAIERDNLDSVTGKDTLFAVITGDGVSVAPAANPAHFFDSGVGDGGVAQTICWGPTVCVYAFPWESRICVCHVLDGNPMQCVCQ